MSRCANVPLRGVYRLVIALLIMANLLVGVTARVVTVKAESPERATAERMPPDPGAMPSLTRTADGRDAVADRIIVGFKDGVGATERGAVHRTVASRGTIIPTAVKRVSDTAEYVDTTGAPSLEVAIQSYRADPRVRYAEPDYIVHALDLPNDQYFGNQYGMNKIQAPAAWSTTHGSGNVKIAILDCGIYEAHPDLAGKVVAHQDFTGSANGTDDRCNHGTHVAGIASAATNNATGVAGLGYNTKLLNGKILSDSGIGYDTQIADGIRWATDNGANVINMSLGGSGACSQVFQDAIDYAWGKNVVVVAAAGNNGGNVPFQPANCAHVLAVASTDANDARSGFSNFGPWVQVAAPGSAIYSTVNPTLSQNGGSAYAYFSGTSMATPHVAGLAALVWATAWGTSADAVVQRIEKSADPIAGTSTNWQFGRINAMAAVSSNLAPPTIAALTPSTASVGGAAFTLTIDGGNFRPGATVLWNGVSRPALSVSFSAITVAVTADDLRAAATATVAVANTDGTTTAALTFTVAIPPPHPTGVTPPSAFITGGKTVTIVGSAFQPGARVTFDGLDAPVATASSTEIAVTTPPHATGKVNVVVTNPDGQSQTLTNGFAYIGIPDPRPGPPPLPSAAPVVNPPPRSPPPGTTSGTNTNPAPIPIPVPVSR